jgi:hypothetical protein
MLQTYTSARTSMNAHKLPRVFGKIAQPPRHSILLDIGSGKYTDHIRAAFPDVTYCPYDPFNQPEDVNRHSLYYARMAAHIRYPVTIVCSNVLNVIDSDQEVQSIADYILDNVTRSGGVAYVTVYTGDNSREGRQTGPDQYQRNAPLADYLPFFRSLDPFPYYGKTYQAAAAIERGMIVVRCMEVKS